MENNQHYSKMKNILEKIQSSSFMDDVNQLVKEYIDIDFELRNSHDCIDINNPNETLDQLLDKKENLIKAYDDKLIEMRNSIKLGSKEFTKVTLYNFQELKDLNEMRANAIKSLIAHRDKIDSKI